MRISTAALIVSALLTQVSYAQESLIQDSPTPLTEDEKAAIERHKQDEKADDEAYKSTIKRLPDATQKVDPWGGVRPAPTVTGNK